MMVATSKTRPPAPVELQQKEPAMRQTLKLISFTGTGLGYHDHLAFRIDAESEVRALPAFTQGLVYARLLAHPAVEAVSYRSVEIVAKLREACTDQVVSELTDIVRRTLEASDAGLASGDRTVEHCSVEIETVERQVHCLGVYPSNDYLGLALGMLDIDYRTLDAFERAAADLAPYFQRTSTDGCRSVMHLTILPGAPSDIRERLIEAMVTAAEANYPSYTGHPVAFVVRPQEPQPNLYAKVYANQ